ncbi:hypothetical protein OAU79_00540, partial [bacterium]|nr:hypothetical protein [bacterium]
SGPTKGTDDGRLSIKVVNGGCVIKTLFNRKHRILRSILALSINPEQGRYIPHHLPSALQGCRAENNTERNERLHSHAGFKCWVSIKMSQDLILT